MVAGFTKWTMNNPLSSPPSSSQCAASGAPHRVGGRSKSPFQEQPATVLQELQDQPACTPSPASKTSFYWPPPAELHAKPPPAKPPPPKSLSLQLPTSSHAKASVFADVPFDSEFDAMPLATPHGGHAAMQQAKRRMHACVQQQARDHITLRSGYRRTGCRSRPSSNDSWKSCDSFAGDLPHMPAAKLAAQTAQHMRCPAPKGVTRTVSQPLPAQQAQHARCPAPTPTTSTSTKRSRPRCTDGAVTTPTKRVSVERPSRSGDVHASRPRSRHTHERHARRRWHSWDVSGKLPLPPSRSTESDQSSDRCHSVLSMLGQRSTVSAALHSTDLDGNDSEDDPEHEAEGTFRNISFLNLGTPSQNEPQPMPAGAFDFDEDEDLQSMPLLQSDPVAPILPSIDPERSTEFSNRKSGAEVPQPAGCNGALGNSGTVSKAKSGQQPAPTGAVNVQLRLSEQLRVGMHHNGADAAESPLRPHVSMSWSVTEAVATIGCGMEELSLYMN